MNQSCVSLGPLIGKTLTCPRNNLNVECSGNGVCSTCHTNKLLSFSLRAINVSYDLLPLKWHWQCRVICCCYIR